MRDDMAQVVTERPRAGGGIKAPKGEKRRSQRLGIEDMPNREKIRQKWDSTDASKNFTDVLGPIYRYLLKQVGQPWDGVWSEVCKKLPANNTNTSHVRDHVLDFVETKTVMIDGKVCYGEGMLYGIPISGRGGRYEWQMYVHPETGLICKVKGGPRSRRQPKKPHGIPVPGEPDKQYHKINGVWYVITLYTPRWMKPHYKVDHMPVDVAYKRRLPYYEVMSLYGRIAYATEKRQINTREIEKAGLKNLAA